MQKSSYEAVQIRLASFESSGNPLHLIEPPASTEIKALREEIGWPAFGELPSVPLVRESLSSIVLAGRFCWERHSKLPDMDRLDSLLEATELSVAAYPLDPGSIPAQLTGICAAISIDGGINAADLHNDALDMLDEALAIGS